MFLKDKKFYQDAVNSSLSGLVCFLLSEGALHKKLKAITVWILIRSQVAFQWQKVNPLCQQYLLKKSATWPLHFKSPLSALSPNLPVEGCSGTSSWTAARGSTFQQLGAKKIACTNSDLIPIIGMFDRDGNGTISLHEFSALWKYITDWQHTFRSYDKDNSGSIDKRELQTGIINYCH